jgi:hypothetical protein
MMSKTKNDEPRTERQIMKAFFKRIGAKGGKKRAKNNTAEQLSAWARRGGRPRKEPKENAPAA